jgi:DNA repair protein RecN (Recombination protein N)
MLNELSIKNFAIIEQLSISFKDGLTVLTGETGAGKSIIIDAIGLLIGGRGSSEFVRYGTEKAELEGLFTIKDHHNINHLAQEYGIEISEGTIILRRDISSSGKSVCRVNGKLVTLSILKELGTALIDVHGQHENQVLMNSENHIHLLDQYGKDEIEKPLLEYREMYAQYKEVQSKLEQITHDEQQMAQRVDLLQFQLTEIENAKLQPKEDEQLLEEKQKLTNFEKLHNALYNSYEALSGDQKGLDSIGKSMSMLSQVESMDDNLKELSQTVSNAFYQLQEASYSIRDYFEGLAFDEERLNEIEVRLNEIHALKRKYGQDASDIISYGEKIKIELSTLTNREEHIFKLNEKIQKLTHKLRLKADKVTKARKNVASDLKKAILKELKNLYMDKTKIEVMFNNSEHLDRFTKNGTDQIEFLISTNPGEPVKPLVKVASGGEISRIMIALKTIFSQHQGMTSIIFDEVDTGVSGRVAQSIAEKIHMLSVGSQVLCITHLPQVAAMSDTHLFISKHEKDKRTYTKITELNHTEKVKEIGRMISGVEVTQLTKDHAEELLQMAEQLKIGT